MAGIIGGAALVGGAISAGITAYQGGSWRQIGTSFAHGVLSGAGAAIGGIAGFAVGGPVGAWAGATAGAGAGGFLGTLAEQAINGDKLCLPCALQAALIEAGITAVLGPIGKLLGKALGPAFSRLANSGAGKAFLNTLKKAVVQVRSKVVQFQGRTPAGMQKLAREAEQTMHPIARSRRTTAIGRDSKGNLHIGSSQTKVPKEQKIWAEQRGIKVQNGEGHAEETLWNNVKDLKHAEPTKPVCVDCEVGMANRGILLTTSAPKFGRPSTRRRPPK